MARKKKYPYIIIFHDGTLGGDTNEARLQTDNPNITFKQALKQLFTIEGLKQNWGLDPDEEWAAVLQDFITCSDDLVGAFIITDEFDAKVNRAYDSLVVCGGDSEAYARHALMKALYNEFAVKRIGVKP